MTCSSCTCFTCWAAKSIEELNSQIEKAKLYDSGTGIITGDPEEPLYGRCRLSIFLFFKFFFYDAGRPYHYRHWGGSLRQVSSLYSYRFIEIYCICR